MIKNFYVCSVCNYKEEYESGSDEKPCPVCDNLMILTEKYVYHENVYKPVVKSESIKKYYKPVYLPKLPSQRGVSGNVFVHTPEGFKQVKDLPDKTTLIDIENREIPVEVVDIEPAKTIQLSFFPKRDIFKKDLGEDLKEITMFEKHIYERVYTSDYKPKGALTLRKKNSILLNPPISGFLGTRVVDYDLAFLNGVFYKRNYVKIRKVFTEAIDKLTSILKNCNIDYESRGVNNLIKITVDNEAVASINNYKEPLDYHYNSFISFLDGVLTCLAIPYSHSDYEYMYCLFTSKEQSLYFSFIFSLFGLPTMFYNRGFKYNIHKSSYLFLPHLFRKITKELYHLDSCLFYVDSYKRGTRHEVYLQGISWIFDECADMRKIVCSDTGLNKAFIRSSFTPLFISKE